MAVFAVTGCSHTVADYFYHYGINILLKCFPEVSVCMWRVTRIEFLHGLCKMFIWIFGTGKLVVEKCWESKELAWVQIPVLSGLGYLVFHKWKLQHVCGAGIRVEIAKNRVLKCKKLGCVGICSQYIIQNTSFLSWSGSTGQPFFALPYNRHLWSG
jgi:hypothetical protein